MNGVTNKVLSRALCSSFNSQTGTNFTKTIFPYWDPTMTLNKELFFMPTLFRGPSVSSSDLADEKTKSELGPMSHKLARMCSESTLNNSGDPKKKPLLFGFDETQSKLLSSKFDHAPVKQEDPNQTSYQSLISQLVDKVTKDMYGKTDNIDTARVDREKEKKLADSEKDEELPFDLTIKKVRSKQASPCMMPYVSDPNVHGAYSTKQEIVGKDSDSSQQSSAFKGASDSIEILRKLKHKVLKKSPQRRGSPSSHTASNTVKAKASARARSTSKNDVNASLMCSPFHAAQERERRKHMMVMISLVCYQGNSSIYNASFSYFIS